MTFAKFVIVFSHIPIAITTGYAVLRYKRLDADLKIFACYLLLSGVVHFITLVTWFYKLNNMPLLHFYVAAGFTNLALFYRAVLRDVLDKKIISIVILVFLAFTLTNSIFIQDIFLFNSYALTVESVLIIILSLSTYVLLLNDIVKETRIHAIKSLNWINSGLFIYYASSLLIFYFGDLITLLSPSYLVRYTWVLHSAFLMIMYACFFVGLWKLPKN
jgi:hypothetical protein